MIHRKFVTIQGILVNATLTMSQLCMGYQRVIQRIWMNDTGDLFECPFACACEATEHNE